MTAKPTRVKTGEVRFSFPKLFEAESFKNDPNMPKKYSIGILIDKADTKTVSDLKAAFEAAKKEHQEKKGNHKSVQNFRFIKLASGDQGFMTDCDEDPNMSEREDYQGHYYLTASAQEKDKPGVMKKENGALMHVTDPDDIYGGCYGKITMNLYGYTAGKGGVTAGLNNVLKTRDGERFSGRASAESDFADEVDEDNAMLYID